MKTATKILIVLTLCLLFAGFTGIVKANVAPPTQQTTFYFQQNGQPITQPVKFNIKCYGTSFFRDEKKSSESEMLKISELSENCLSYGCKFDTSNIFEVYGKDIKYCTLDGDVNGQKFTVDKFLGDNLSELSCHGADYTISTDGKYYKETSQYNECKKNVYREYYPQGNGEVTGDFLCYKSLVEVPKNECAGYGYITINDVCYKFTSETYACIAEEDRKTKACDQYLEDVTEKLAKDKEGNPFKEICEAKVNVPVEISNTNKNNQQASNVQPITPTEQPHKKNIFSRIIDFFKCTFLKIFGKSC